VLTTPGPVWPRSTAMRGAVVCNGCWVVEDVGMIADRLAKWRFERVDRENDGLFPCNSIADPRHVF